MIVGNFTPDPIKWMHIGITGTIEPGQTEEMQESRAKHVLNKFARRGLVQMQYGDDLEEKKKESLALWTNFWEQQITNFNQHNQDQKEKGSRYTRPSEELKAHAKLLNLELLQPWRIESKESPELKRLQDENLALRTTIEKQAEQIEEIRDMIKQANRVPEPEPDKEPEEPEKTLEEIITENKKRYASLSANTMPGWVKNNWDEIQEMPEENRFEIQTKYEALLQTPFPVEKPA